MSNFIDLKNKKFGRLLVLSLDHMAKNGAYWLCECQSDGNKIIVAGTKLRNGHTKSCGCILKEKLKDRLINLIGKTFGKLKVIKQYDDYISPNGVHLKQWLCKCENDNNLIVVLGNNLKRGSTTTCGCLAESVIASELKTYYLEKYSAIIEYNVFKNPKTNHWLPYDIYIPIKNIFIEINGKQHYQNDNHFFKTKNEFDDRKKLDRMKRKYARQNGLYIEIDLRKIETTEQAIKFIEKRIEKVKI
jgi:hypothetical protein